jgi:hypothetical protein
MYRDVVRAGIIAIAALLVPVAATAQEAIAFGSVSGRVTDATGAVVANVRASARHLVTNTLTSTITDAEGRFRFAYLRTGVYELTFETPGFARADARVTITAGAAFDLPISLAVAAFDSAVTVRADATVLETARTQVTSMISAAEAASVPMNGRNVLEMALLAPGVSPANVGGGAQLFPETSAVPGVTISIGSQRNLSNNFMVDGLSANDDAAALSGIAYSVDAVDELQVITSGGQAEMGRALGGYVSLVTRSGTNLMSGTAYGFFRDDRLNAGNPLLAQSAPHVNGGKLPMHQNQFGASLSGPIRRDRTFAFVNLERRNLDQSALVTVSPGDVDAINARLTSAGYPGARVATGIVATPVNTTHFMAKVDHNISASDHLSIRYAVYRVAGEHARGTGGTATASASAALASTDQTVAAGNVRVFGRTILESRGQVARSQLSAPPTDPMGPAVNIAGVASFGTSSGSPTGRANWMSQIVNNISRQAGSHALRAGLDVLANRLTIAYPRAIRGSYTFSSLADFLSGTYTSTGFTQTFGDSVIGQTNTNVGLYVQDEWHARSGLTFNIGLRYDLQFLETIHTDIDNVSPRAGAVWTPVASGRWVVRANAGRFFDRVPLRALANALLSAGNTTDLAKLRQVSVTLGPAQASAPAFPAILPSVVPSTTLVSVTSMDRHLQNAHSDQGSVEVERQLGRSATLSVAYEHLRARQLIMSINRNVPTCPVSGTNNGCRPNPAYANNSQYSSAGAADYNGLHVSLAQRPASWGSYRVSYALSKSMNNVGEAFFSSPLDPSNLDADWGRSDDDQRHRLVVLASVQAPTESSAGGIRRIANGLQVSVLVQYSSALPFNITTGANTVQGTAARPTVDGVSIARNAGQGSAFSTTSLRVSRTIATGRGAKIQGLVEVFNLFNRRNDVARIAVFGTGSYPDAPAENFGQVTVVGDPRSVQLGVRMTF